MAEVVFDAQVTKYLEQLNRALSPLADAKRAELVSEIADHIKGALQLCSDPSQADIQNLLDQIGQPEDIAAEALGTVADEVPGTRAGVQESLAIALLLVGAFLLVVGWVVGLVLLWTSSVWRLRDKLIGTFLLPGGLLPAFILIAGNSTLGNSGKVCSGTLIPGTSRERVICTTTSHGSSHASVPLIVLFVFLIVIPLVTAVYLNRRRRSSPLRSF